MSDYRWGGLHLSRTLLPTASFITGGGHVREVVLTEADLLAIIRDAAHALGQRQEAHEWNVRRGTAPATSESDEQGDRPATPDANGVHDTKGGE